MKTIATSLIVSFALIGAAQAGTPRGDIDNVPFQGNYAQADNFGQPCPDSSRTATSQERRPGCLR